MIIDLFIQVPCCADGEEEGAAVLQRGVILFASPDPVPASLCSVCRMSQEADIRMLHHAGFLACGFS